MVEVTPFSAALGAVVSGVDAAHATDDDIAAVRAAVVEHLVVVLPGQQLDDQQHEAFMARFGPLHFHPFLRLMDVPETNVQMIEQTMESPSGVDNWHTDLIFVPVLSKETLDIIQMQRQLIFLLQQIIVLKQ